MHRTLKPGCYSCKGKIEASSGKAPITWIYLHMRQANPASDPKDNKWGKAQPGEA
jgi:hypothetical protein